MKLSKELVIGALLGVLLGLGAAKCLDTGCKCKGKAAVAYQMGKKSSDRGVNQRMRHAVESGRITQEQADERMKGLRSRRARN